MSPGENRQYLVEIILRSRLSRHTHGIRRFLHGPHDSVRYSLYYSHIFCEGSDEPVNIKNIIKVTAHKKKTFSVKDCVTNRFR